MTNWMKAIEADLEWREKELASIKRLAIVNSENGVVCTAILRSAWAILYAHFEGFTKFAWELLLDQVQSKGVSIERLRKDFLILALEKQFRILRGNLSSHRIWEFFDSELPNELKLSAGFAKDCRLETENNLWPNIFDRECAKVGIVSTVMNSSRIRMKTLVSRRNDIAHGKKMTIGTISEYSQYEHTTLLVMHDLAVQILEILEEEKYLK